MIRKCRHCGSSLLESEKQCSYCFREMDENSIAYSFDGNSVYVKRENGKIFGPFPLDRVISLVQTQKLKPSEWVSDNRNEWIEVERCIEFTGIAKSSPDLPGLKPDLPGLKPDLPGLKPDLPGLKPDLPGLKPDLPGLKPDLPGVKSDLPGVRSDLPGVRSDLPGVRSDLPGVKSDLPGVRSDLPGVRSDLPGVRSDLPGVHSDLLGVKSEFPDVRTEEEAKASEEFSLPPIGGGSLPELNIEGSTPLELKLDDFLNKSNELQSEGKSEDGKIRSSLFDTSEGIDFSSLSSSSSPAGGIPSSSGLSISQEVTIPIEDESEEALPQVARKTTAPAEEKKGVNPKILLLVMIVAVAGVAAYFLFSGKNGTKEKPAPVIHPAKISKQELSEHERNLLELNYEKIASSISGKELIHCESAMVLAWLFHDTSKIDACADFAGQPESAMDASLRRFQFLRAMVMNKYPKASWNAKIWASKNPVDFKRVAEEVLSKSRSENQNSLFWRFMSGIWNLENRKKDRAMEEFNFIRNTETSVPAGVLWFSFQAGDEKAIQDLGKKPEHAFWKDLMESERFLVQHEKDFSFLFIPEGFPEIKADPKDAENAHGMRFAAMHQAFAALSAWIRGNIDESLALCDAALQKDASEAMTAKICRGLQIFHGQFGKIAVQIPEEPDFAHIVSLLVEGRTQTAISYWEEWKKTHSGQAIEEVLVKLLSRADREEWKKALWAGLDAGVEKTLDLLWVAIWQVDLDSWMREDLNAWKEEKKYEGKSIQAFLDLMDMVGDFRRGDPKIRERKIPDGISPAAAFVIEGLRMQMELLADKKNEKALQWLEKTAASMTSDARLAAAAVRMYTHLEKIQEAHVILDRIQEKFMDPQLYKAAAQLHLAGTRPDRLMRARFFAEKASKVNPQDFESLMVLGFVQLESGQFDSGEKSLMQAVSLMNTPDPRWFMRWSELESRLKRSQMALAAMDAGLRKIPDYVPFVFRKAQIFATQDKPREALDLLEKTKNSEGIEEVQKFILVGRCHLSLRQKKEAEDAFSKAVKSDPDNILARYMLGKTAISNGNMRQAVLHLEEAVRKLEKVQSEQKIPQEAEHWQTETVDGMLAESYRLLGGAYKEMGNRQQALNYFKKYAAIVPDGPMKDEAMRMILLLGGE